MKKKFTATPVTAASSSTTIEVTYELFGRGTGETTRVRRFSGPTLASALFKFAKACYMLTLEKLRELVLDVIYDTEGRDAYYQKEEEVYTRWNSTKCLAFLGGDEFMVNYISERLSEEDWEIYSIVDVNSGKLIAGSNSAEVDDEDDE